MKTQQNNKRTTTLEEDFFIFLGNYIEDYRQVREYYENNDRMFTMNILLVLKLGSGILFLISWFFTGFTIIEFLSSCRSPMDYLMDNLMIGCHVVMLRYILLFLARTIIIFTIFEKLKMPLFLLFTLILQLVLYFLLYLLIFRLIVYTNFHYYNPNKNMTRLTKDLFSLGGKLQDFLYNFRVKLGMKDFKKIRQQKAAAAAAAKAKAAAEQAAKQKKWWPFF
jgi:hypothetical protein